jgi:cell division transport system permease protein
MTKIFTNAGYFFKETFTMVRLSLISNILSLLSTGLIFFILAMVISGWWIMTEISEAIRGEAEISAYFDRDVSPEEETSLVGSVGRISGVKDSRLVDEKEAYGNMEKILGKDAQILNVFDENPFTAYIEINIDLDSVDRILKELDNMPGISYVRDNRDVLDRINSLTRLFLLIGYLVLAAAGISTLVIISHIVRLAVRDNREQINTLGLLGAPWPFIAFPFILQGLLLTLGGAILATVLSVFVLKQVYSQIAGPLPFIPLPPAQSVASGMAAVILSAGLVLGAAGSMLGLASSRGK